MKAGRFIDPDRLPLAEILGSAVVRAARVLRDFRAVAPIFLWSRASAWVAALLAYVLIHARQHPHAWPGTIPSFRTMSASPRFGHDGTACYSCTSPLRVTTPMPARRPSIRSTRFSLRDLAAGSFATTLFAGIAISLLVPHMDGSPFTARQPSRKENTKTLSAITRAD